MTTDSAPGRALVINGHPDETSLCGALAGIAADTTQSAGAEMRRLHLSAMAFDAT
jgi:putative NADPH-quinone reductase